MSRADEFQGSLTILRPVQITSQWVEKSSKRVLFGSTGFYCVLISFSSGEKRERDSVVTQRATSLFPTESSVGERTLFGRNDERERETSSTDESISIGIDQGSGTFTCRSATTRFVCIGFWCFSLLLLLFVFPSISFSLLTSPSVFLLSSFFFFLSLSLFDTRVSRVAAGQKSPGG